MKHIEELALLGCRAPSRAPTPTVGSNVAQNGSRAAAAPLPRERLSLAQADAVASAPSVAPSTGSRADVGATLKKDADGYYHVTERQERDGLPPVGAFKVCDENGKVLRSASSWLELQ